MFVVHRARDFGMKDKLISGDGVVTGSGLINGRLVYIFLKILLSLRLSIRQMPAK